MSQNDFKNDPRDVGGLKMFLFTVLDLIKSGKKETCQDIEDNIKVGITKYLVNKYEPYFSKYYNSANNDSIDDFYRLCDNKFDRDEDDGLYWLIEQALNELH